MAARSPVAPLLAAVAFATLAALAGCGSKGARTSTSSSAASSGSGAGGAGGAGTSSSGSSGGATSSGSSASSGTTGSGGAGGGAGLLARFPDTSASIAVLADQLPGGMSAAQTTFAATHYVGSQKLTLALSGPLRAVNPKFVVLHYHLAIWQSAPGVDFILDGTTWSNDYPTVTTHESWFWHNQQDQRVASTADGKLLMNLTDPGFAAYWQSSLEAQVVAGQYDGIFFDSASPALLQGEVGGQDPRLAGTGAKDSSIAEWGAETYIQGWEAWIKPLNDALAAKGIPLIPNTGPFITGWDNTDYSLTAGIFSEGFADPSFAPSDWKASTSELLSLVAKDKIVILQNYLGAPSDVQKRLYYLANYLLVRGKHTYLDYFAAGPFEWYPEWGLDLGAATTTGATADDLLQGGVYRRDFEKGSVLVNPSGSPVTVMLGASMNQVVPMGGGAIDATGATPGSITLTPVTAVTLPPQQAAVLLH